MNKTSRSLTLHWPPPLDSADESAPRVLLLGLWLVGWAALETLVFGLGFSVFDFDVRGPALQIVASTFMRVWFVGLTVGGIYAEVFKYLLGPGPERIVLTGAHLRYVPSRGRRAKFGARIPWHQLSALKLDAAGERQRLLLDRGAHQIEIGEHLDNPDREWLVEVIWSRANRNGYR